MILLESMRLLPLFILVTGCGWLPAGTTGADNASSAPATITAGGTATAHSVQLSWNASTSREAIGYYVYRGTQPGPPYTTFTKLTPSPIPATAYTDSTMAAGATYCYVVTAVNGSGTESSYSNQASVTIAGT